jgi:uncharacterized protein (TIGR02284 family)
VAGGAFEAWAGARGFRDFPLLAGGEGESQWQPPDPAYTSRRKQIALSKIVRDLMPQPSKELEQAESAMQSVIDALIDSQEAFQQIGSELKDETLKRYFMAESLKRAEFRGEIESVLHREGVRDIKEAGTTAGTVHRAWADLKSRLGGGDHTLLATAEQGEDAARDAYDKAMDTYLPLPVRQLLTSQAAHVQSSHDFVKAARDSTS